MSRRAALLALLGLLLVAAPMASLADEDYDEDEDEKAKGGEDEEKDVVVATQKNWDDVIKKSKFALVSRRMTRTAGFNRTMCTAAAVSKAS